MKNSENTDTTPDPERILLCVSGMTPAIITETYYYLAKLREPAFIPERVIIVTTEDGRERIQQDLFDTPRFRQMCEANGWNPDSFTPADVVTVMDRQGNPLKDVRTPEQFHAFADTLMKQVKALVEPRRKRPAVIHASLAGGRKTMSYYMGQVMSVFGRPTDFLSHVLVHERFEINGLNFYYPGQQEALRIRDRFGNIRPFEGTADEPGILDLSEFPVIPVSSQTNLSRFLHSRLSFQDILQAARDELNGVIHPIHFSRGNANIDVRFGYDRLTLTPKELSYLLWLGWRQRKGTPAVDTTLKGELRGEALKARAAILQQYYAELVVLGHYIRDNGLPFSVEECEKLTLATKDQQSFIRTDFSRLREKLGGISSVYALTVYKDTEVARRSERLDPTRDVRARKQKPAKKSEAPPRYKRVVVKGHHAAPPGLLRDQDFAAIDAFMSANLPLVIQALDRMSARL